MTKSTMLLNIIKILLNHLYRKCANAKTACTRLLVSLFLFFFLFFFYGKASAQEFLFNPIEGREQLNEEKIRNFIELNDGRIGVFTEGMLNLYDSNGFKTIEIDDENAIPLTSYTGFHHSYIENNHIWFKSGGKLSLINISKEKCETDPLKVLTSLGFKEKPTDLFVDQKKDIWIVSATGKILCYEQASKKVIPFLKNFNTDYGSDDDVLYDLVLHKNQLYLFYKSGLVRCFDRSSAKEIYKRFIIKDPGNNFTQWLHAASVKNYIYVVRAGIRKGQLIRFDTQTRESIIILQSDSYWLNSFAANKKGDFLMSSREGFWSFKANSTHGTFYPELDLYRDQKIKTEVSTLIFDHQGGLWAGTLNKGLYYHHTDRSKFKFYQKKHFKLQDKNELQVNCFQETKEGKLLIGTNNALFEAELPLHLSKTFKTILPNLYCNSLFKDSSGLIWISTSKGLYVMDKNNSIKNCTAIATNYVFETTNGDLFICTADGISKWNKSLNSFGLIPLITSLPNVLQMTQWNNQLIGISYKGPFLMNLTGTKVTIPGRENQNKLPMFSQKNHKYTCVLADSDQDLWIGTYNGLTVWDTKNEKSYLLNTDKDLVNNSIKAIVQDKDHSFWITTSRGVSHIIKKRSLNKLTFRIINHDKNTGILEYPFTERAAFISVNSGLFMGGIDGMNNLPNADENGHHAALNPILLNLKLFGKNILPGKDHNGSVVLKKSMPTTDTLELKYNQNFFSISFSGLNYSNPEQTFYKYKLHEIDEDWRIENPKSAIGEASYTNIAPGRYVFEVQASSDGLNWQGSKKKLLVIIAPPAWKTPAAQFLYFIVSLLALGAFLKAMAKRNAAMHKKRQDYAVEKAKSDFITNMSHELRTPLTLIITPLKSLISKVEDQKIKNDLIRISSNSDLLLDTVNQLLDFKKIDNGDEVLQAHFFDNLSFLNEIFDAYQPLASEKRILLSCNIDQQITDLYIDRQKITRILINLLSNAIKFTNVGGIVKLSATIDKAVKTLTILVEDSGVGIPASEIDTIFNRFYQASNQNGLTKGSGIGLFMVKYYAEMHGGSVSVKSVLNQGTVFKVILSVEKKESDAGFELPAEKFKKNILIVEDHSVFRNYLFDELKDSYNVMTAKNGLEGLEKTKQNSFDLIITDFMMPEMDGSQLCQSLRNTIDTSHIPIIMLTGRASDQARFEGYDAGADAYLVKPFDIKLLLLRINKLLEITAARRQAFINDKELNIDSLTVNELDKAFLARAYQHIENNLSNPDYTVEKFSEDMNMDRTGLYRKLIALTDHSPTNFIRTIRLKKAAELLLDKKLTIADVSEQTGFNSISYFTKCFHEAFGKTPGQSRDQNASGA